MRVVGANASRIGRIPTSVCGLMKCGVGCGRVVGGVAVGGLDRWMGGWGRLVGVG